MAHLLLVTGGSSGLGRAVLATAPSDAHGVTISRRSADDVARGHIAADLADPASWARVGDVIDALATERQWERITFVQAAGTIAPIGFAGEVDPARYAANVLLNAAAPQVLGHRFLAAVSHLHARRELVLVSSGAANKDYPGWSSYGAAKAGVDRWASTVGAEQELRGGTRVLSIAPGVVDTDMQAMVRATDPRDFPGLDRFEALHREGQLADPEDTARRLWEAVDDRAVVSGSVLDLRDRPR
ncbi:MAG: SDR family NAD(P)-dependent oxidoreductase [Nitriliruptoraceae bacterium]